MSATIYNFTLEQGATFSATRTFTNDDGTVPDVTSMTAHLALRDDWTDVPLLDLTDSNGIKLQAGGKVTITISATDTSQLSFRLARYDLVLEDAAGDVRRFLEGRVLLDLAATTKGPIPAVPAGALVDEAGVALLSEDGDYITIG